MRHPSEFDLALYAGEESAGWTRWLLRRHVQRCASCQATVAQFCVDREEVMDWRSQMPDFVNWDRLAAEMRGNIRVGLAAGECVAVRSSSTSIRWQHAAGAALAAGLLLGAWVLNVPQKPGAVSQAMHRQGVSGQPELQMTPGGIAIKADGRALTLVHNDGSKDSELPTAIYTSSPDMLSVRSFDRKTGQISVHVVSYAE